MECHKQKVYFALTGNRIEPGDPIGRRQIFYHSYNDESCSTVEFVERAMTFLHYIATSVNRPDRRGQRGRGSKALKIRMVV
jgi:hypothetical protein